MPDQEQMGPSVRRPALVPANVDMVVFGVPAEATKEQPVCDLLCLLRHHQARPITSSTEAIGTPD